MQPVAPLGYCLSPLGHTAPQLLLIYNRALSIVNDISPKNLRKSTAVGAVLHSDRTPAAVSFRSNLRRTALVVATLAVVGCGSTYRPVVSSINPVGPAGQPTKYAVAVSGNGTSAQGLVTLIDFSGDTIVNTTLIGVNPQYFVLTPTGFEGYTINGDGTLNSFSVSSSLLASQVLQSTLFSNSNPVSLFPQGTYIYVAEGNSRKAIAEMQGTPPAIQQELPTGLNTVYTVGTNSAPRVYALVQGTPGSIGNAVPIETASNTIDTPIPVGITPVYGVMSADSRRAFILNKGSNSVSVINAQTNALDTFLVNGTTTSTVPVGVAPVWADFAPTLNELLVANAGNGTTPGSVSIINIPLCSSSTVTTNPNCDTTNPIDATGFGTVLATIPVGVNPVMIAVLQDGTQAYVANAGNPNLPCAAPTTASPVPNCSISVINLATETVVATIPAIESTNEADATVHGRPAWIAATTGTPTGKVYVTSPDSTDISIIRTDLNAITTHLSLQGFGVSVRVNQP